MLAVLIPLALLAGSGDVNGDGKINVADIVEIINYLNGHPSENFNAYEADTNNNGHVDEGDVRVLSYIITETPYLTAEKREDPKFRSTLI